MRLYRFKCVDKNSRMNFGKYLMSSGLYHRFSKEGKFFKLNQVRAIQNSYDNKRGFDDLKDLQLVEYEVKEIKSK